jgi:hypothetical protein
VLTASVDALGQADLETAVQQVASRSFQVDIAEEGHGIRDRSSSPVCNYYEDHLEVSNRHAADIEEAEVVVTGTPR